MDQLCPDSEIMKFDMTNWPRAPDDSAQRCKSGNRRGQCSLSVVSGSDYCPIHGGLHAIRKRNEEAKVRMLKFITCKDQLPGDDSEIKSLKSEIMALKGLLTIIWNRCKDEQDLALRAGPIGDLCTKIERLVAGAHKLDKELGEMLSQAQIEEFGMEVIDIVSRNVTDSEIREVIANEILEAIDSLAARRPDRVQQL